MIAALMEFATGAETGFEAVFAALTAGLPPVDDVTSTSETIKGVDRNDIGLSTTMLTTSIFRRGMPDVYAATIHDVHASPRL